MSTTHEVMGTLDLRRDGCPDTAPVDHLPVAVLVTGRDGRVERANLAWSSLTGLHGDRSLGHGWLDVVSVDDVGALLEALGKLAGAVCDVRLVRRTFDDEQVTRWTRWSWLAEEPGARRVVTIVDIDADRTREHDLRRRATRDALTGVANRRQFLETLDASIRAIDPERGDAVVLVYLDLDRFKAVNDRGGHLTDDAVLAHVAQRLMAATRPDDLVGRLGGDEFGVICRGVHNPTECDALVERLLRAFDDPIHVHGTPWSVSATAGVATATLPVHEPDDLLRAADEDMYAVKGCRPDSVDAATEQARRALLEVSDQLAGLWSTAVSCEAGTLGRAARIGDAARHVRSAMIALGPQVIS